MKEADRRFDVAIVGGGIAGLVAGVRLAELGKRVGVLEQGDGERYPCNSRLAGGLFHVCMLDPAGDERVLDAAGKPIPGLHAAGCATGGLEGGEFAGYVGGLAKSAATAFRAANDIAGDRTQ